MCFELRFTLNSLCLQTHKESKGLQAEVTTVDEVAKKDETCIGILNGGCDVLRRGSGRTSGLRGIVIVFFGDIVLTLAVTSSLDLLSQLRVGDLCRGLDHVRANDRLRSCGRLGRGLARHASADAEELKKIVELAMDIAADGDGCDHGLDVALCDAKGQSSVW